MIASIMQIHESICEKHIFGRSTRALVVRADTSDEREWLQEAPVCSELADRRIAHCGIMDAAYPFEVIRMNLSGTFFLSCIEGKGDILVDGWWQTIEPGFACLQPPFITNAVKAKRRGRWKFCWVRYHETPGTGSIVTLDSPALLKCEWRAIHAALTGLHAEATTTNSPAALRAWADLIHGYVISFASPFRDDDRLQNLWLEVQSRLDHDWTVKELAKNACLSKEHLRRLVVRSLGRAPMQHVAFLRMRRAAELLESTDHKIAHVAREVGYANPYAFSDAFQKWVGLRPSVYRVHSRAR